MKKWTLLLLAGLLTAGNLSAREKADTTYWSHAGLTGINLSQVSLTNWAAGGNGSIAFDLMFNFDLNYTRDKHLWKNRLELAYGMNNTQTIGARKGNDKIYLSSTYGYKIAKTWYASAQMTFNTQFANGYNYATTPPEFVSQFMAPGYLNIGLGFLWQPKPWFSANFAPAAWRGTFVENRYLSDQGMYGVDPGKRLLNEFGGNVTLDVTYEFLPNMTVHSRLDLYSNYLKNPQNIVVNWDTQIAMKINKWFSANLGLTMIYDDKIKITDKSGHTGARLQFKEVLGIGLQARF